MKNIYFLVVLILMCTLTSCTPSTPSSSELPSVTLQSIPNQLSPTATTIRLPSETPTQRIPSGLIDEDGDGLLASEEGKYGTSDQETDTDNDELDDYIEVVKYFTNPTQSDTDGNGKLDWENGDRYKRTSTTFVRVWARYMGDVEKMTGLYQDVTKVITQDDTLLKVEVALLPDTKPYLSASMFDTPEDIQNHLGRYPQAKFSSTSLNLIKTVAGNGTMLEKANRVNKWFRATFMQNEQLPQDGWRRSIPSKDLGDYELSDFIFRQLRPNMDSSDPYKGHDESYEYFSFDVNGKKQNVEIPSVMDPDWEFIHRFWFWRTLANRNPNASTQDR